MSKVIQGKINTILSENSFTMKPVGNYTDFIAETDNPVNVTIANSDPPRPNTLSGTLARIELEKSLAGRRISCEIVGHGFNNEIIANINLCNSNKD